MFNSINDTTMTKMTKAEVAQLPQSEKFADPQSASNEQTKMCHSCGRELPINCFSRHDKSKDGHMNECKECRRRKSSPTDAKGNPLEKFTARELMHELGLRGYRGEITFTEVKVHKMNLKDF